MAYSRTRQEQETSIVWDDDEKVAHIYTCSPVTMRKLDKLVESNPDTYSCTWTDGEAKRYEVNKKYVRFGKPASQNLVEAARKNAKNLWGKNE